MYLSIKGNSLSQDFHTLQLFNEVYYLCSRIVNENDAHPNLDWYIQEIKRDMGWDYPSSIVVNMTFVVLSLRKNNSEAITKWLDIVKIHYRMDTYRSPFTVFVREEQERNTKYNINLGISTTCNIVPLEPKDKQHTTTQGTTIVYQIQHADIHVETPGNFIANQITTK